MLSANRPRLPLNLSSKLSYLSLWSRSCDEHHFREATNINLEGPNSICITYAQCSDNKATTLLIVNLYYIDTTRMVRQHTSTPRVYTLQALYLEPSRCSLSYPPLSQAVPCLVPAKRPGTSHSMTEYLLYIDTLINTTCFASIYMGKLD